MESEKKIAVHFGAGNIGRGFIGALLQDAGYFVVFADVNDKLVAAMRSKGSYRLIELADEPRTKIYNNFKVLHAASELEELIELIAKAEVVTTSVGAGVLRRLSPTIERALEIRQKPDKLVVMACENAIGASDTIKSGIVDQQLAERAAIFCNTAVDRIVPLQSGYHEPDVSVEEFSEWIIDSGPLEGRPLSLPGATFVRDLGPFIERKLYTVNTAHLAIALLGQLSGHKTIVEAMSDPDVMVGALAALEETSAVLMHKHGFRPEEHRAYVDKTLARLSSPAVDDEIVRVGRDPLRKLSRFERLIGPAAYHAEHIGTPHGLLAIVGAALRFVSSEDAEAEKLQILLKSLSPAEFIQQVCGIESDHPLHQSLVDAVQRHDNPIQPQNQHR